jgi:hypothetical protein
VCLGFTEFSAKLEQADVSTVKFVWIRDRYEQLIISGRPILDTLNSGLVAPERALAACAKLRVGVVGVLEF